MVIIDKLLDQFFLRQMELDIKLQVLGDLLRIFIEALSIFLEEVHQ
jgi:hypothetical protein